MRRNRRTLRWTAATALAATALLTTGSAEALAESPPTQSRTATTAQDPGSKAEPRDYRGVQGFNLCLISRCTTGSDAADGAGTGADDPVTEGIRQTQGGNICILSTCTVQP